MTDGRNCGNSDFPFQFRMTTAISGFFSIPVSNHQETGNHDRQVLFVEAVKDFGRELLKYVLNHNEELEKHLTPIIENWDIDRVAAIDMILIKMSLGEMLIFPSIPTKVSINEYVELSKSYSTDKSKDFVNGVLDKALHTLSGKNLISKSGRGLTE